MPNKTPSEIPSAVGRRKTATAKVKLVAQKNGTTMVNNQPFEKYFSDPGASAAFTELIRTTNSAGKFAITVKVSGSGKQAQLGATILALSRVLAKIDSKLQPVLRKRGFLTRDPRARQRERFGLMGARKQKQSPKR